MFGILQGMGKTVAVILLCQKNRGSAGMPTLIVCPLGLLNQWQAEIDGKTKKENKFNILVYHDTTVKTLNKEGLKKADIVLTTYDTVASTSGVPSKPKKQRKGSQVQNTMNIGDA